MSDELGELKKMIATLMSILMAIGGMTAMAPVVQQTANMATNIAVTTTTTTVPETNVTTTVTTTTTTASSNPTSAENDYLRLYVPTTEVYENELLVAELTVKQKPPIPSGYSAIIGITDENNRFVAGADLILSETWNLIQYPWTQNYRITPAYIEEVSGNRICFGLLPGTYNIYGTITWTDTDYRYIKVGPITVTVKAADHLALQSISGQVNKTAGTLTLTFTYNTLSKDIYVHIVWSAQGEVSGQRVWDTLYHDVVKLSAGTNSYTLTWTTSYNITGYSTFKVFIDHGSDAKYEFYPEVIQ